MTEWKVDRRKMYAHVFFDLSKDNLGIAVYSIGKIPGFSGKMDPELQEYFKKDKAYKLFTGIMGDKISKEDLQLGKILPYSNIESEIEKLDLMGKVLAKDKTTQITVNLDDPLFWFNSKIKEFPEDKRKIAENLPLEKKTEFGNKIKEAELSLIKESKTPEELEDAMQKVYTIVSRKVSPKTGPKDVSKAVPPTFLFSKEFDIAYYPGFRGAQYMAQVPTPSKSIYTHKEEPEQQWFNILIPDTKVFLDGQPLSSMKIGPLDYATEVLARLFFHSLPIGTELKVVDFNKAIQPVSEKARQMLIKIAKEYTKTSSIKIAQNMIGKWVNLETGRIYDSEQSLLVDMDEEERLPLAAKLKFYKLAIKFLNKNKNIYNELIKRAGK